ncbi:MAG TPA: hypothetical protein VFZ18_07140 [Longimicrobiaceae bacterium]
MVLSQLLDRSQASPDFRRAVAAFLGDSRPNDGVTFDRFSPPVKVERTLTKLLEEHPELEIERVEIDGSSGCEYYRGLLRIHTSEGIRKVRFHWDCKWRALQEGWTDYFGFPDQTRAAREFGHDCFRIWESEQATG